jgi:hypothetical protein
MLKTFEEHKAVQESINAWRNKVGALDSEGWYPYISEVVTEKYSESKEIVQNTHLPQDNKVTTQFKKTK